MPTPNRLFIASDHILMGFAAFAWSPAMQRRKWAVTSYAKAGARAQNRLAGRRQSAVIRGRALRGSLAALQGSRIVELVGDNGGVADLSEVLAAAGVRPGDLAGLAVGADGGVTVATDAGEWQPAAAGWDGLADQVTRADREV